MNKKQPAQSSSKSSTKNIQIIKSVPKQALPGARIPGGFMLEPEALSIVGIDVPPDESNKHLLDRKSNAEPVNPALVKNMKVFGCGESIVVTKIGNRIYVVDGRGRVRSGRQANIELLAEGKVTIKLPAVAKSGETRRIFGFVIGLNRFRREVGSIDCARQVAEYKDLGGTDEEAVVTFGVSRATLGNYRRLLELEPEVQAAIEANTISASEALEKCHGKSREHQLKYIAAPEPRLPRGRPAGPSRVKLRKLLEAPPAAWTPDFIRGLRYGLGDFEDKEVGLVVEKSEEAP